MKEFMDGFKVELEKMMDDWYCTLENLVNDALFDMTLFEGDVDDHYAILQEMMIKVLQERLAKVCAEDEDRESN